ncbi:MAG: 4Fe-4S binding protein [Clostridiales bacterium]|nr:4Fe-4S binding protein [Clostridiales bacterium]
MKKKFSFRLMIQLIFTALSNGFFTGFLQGKIYQGPMKQFCLPGLNCYSCPGALGSCPIGALQSVLASRNYQMSFYVLGFLMAVGALVGRLVCGFLCPFGLVQDLLHKIPLPKKIKIQRLPGEGTLKYFKYAVLVIFVVLLPSVAVNIIGQGDPWFCKYICPSGTLMGGIPLVMLGEGFQEAAGALFDWKLSLLILFMLFSMIYYRPFCRFVCPLGAIYGLTNPISFYHYKIDASRCTKCGKCQKACKLGIDPTKTPNSPECIRCGECLRACPHGAILPKIRIEKKKKSSCKGNCASCKHCGQ